MNGFSILGFPPTFSPTGYSLPRGSLRPPGILNRSGIFGAVAFGDAGAKCWSFTWGFHGDFRGCFNGDLSDKWIYNGSLTIYNDNSSR